MAASSLRPHSATSWAAPAVSASTTGVSFRSARMRRTWPSATVWEWARLMSAMVAPLTPSRQCSTRWNCSPMMNRPESGSRWWMSGTRPARLFSQGSMPQVA